MTSVDFADELKCHPEGLLIASQTYHLMGLGLIFVFDHNKKMYIKYMCTTTSGQLTQKPTHPNKNSSPKFLVNSPKYFGRLTHIFGQLTPLFFNIIRQNITLFSFDLH